MTEEVEALLARRRDSAIKIILRLKERECDHFLPEEAQHALRKVVLDQVNEFYDVAAGILRSLDNGSVVLNEEYLHKIDVIHEALMED